tara:strand:- start:218 stop:853 length:636 start_codon:yes stop_codon:yes gene_type:complete
MKQTILLIIFILLPSVLKSQSQSAILKGQDTVVVFPSAESGVFQVEILTGLIPEELHSLTNKYSEYDYSFKDEEDLRSTMSSYLNDGFVVVNWQLTKNEKSLLKKYKQKAFKEWKKNESLTRRKVDNSETTRAVDNNNSTTAGEHLRKAGRYKNTSIAILIGSGTAAGALISADPIAATVIGTVGSLASLALNIAGNMELIAAGRALDSKP